LVGHQPMTSPAPVYEAAVAEPMLRDAFCPAPTDASNPGCGVCPLFEKNRVVSTGDPLVPVETPCFFSSAIWGRFGPGAAGRGIVRHRFEGTEGSVCSTVVEAADKGFRVLGSLADPFGGDCSSASVVAELRLPLEGTREALVVADWHVFNGTAGILRFSRIDLTQPSGTQLRILAMVGFDVPDFNCGWGVPEKQANVILVSPPKLALEDVDRDGTIDLVAELPREVVAVPSATWQRARLACQKKPTDSVNVAPGRRATTVHRLRFLGRDAAPDAETQEKLARWAAETPLLSTAPDAKR
jgi:hypothetical protein